MLSQSVMPRVCSTGLVACLFVLPSLFPAAIAATTEFDNPDGRTPRPPVEVPFEQYDVIQTDDHWGNSRIREPNTEHDTRRYMWQTMPGGAQARVYFDTMLVSRPIGQTSVTIPLLGNPEFPRPPELEGLTLPASAPGTLPTTIAPVLVDAYAYLGMWRDCNGDGYIGDMDTGLIAYPAATATVVSGVCPYGSAHYPVPPTGEISGGTIIEFLWIGPGWQPPEYPSLHITDNQSRVWGDFGLEAQRAQETIQLFPLPAGSLDSAAGLVAALDGMLYGSLHTAVNGVTATVREATNGLYTVDAWHELDVVLRDPLLNNPFAAEVRGLYNNENDRPLFPLVDEECALYDPTDPEAFEPLYDALDPSRLGSIIPMLDQGYLYVTGECPSDEPSTVLAPFWSLEQGTAAQPAKSRPDFELQFRLSEAPVDSGTLEPYWPDAGGLTYPRAYTNYLPEAFAATTGGLSTFCDLYCTGWFSTKPVLIPPNRAINMYSDKAWVTFYADVTNQGLVSGSAAASLPAGVQNAHTYGLTACPSITSGSSNVHNFTNWECSRSTWQDRAIADAAPNRPVIGDRYDLRDVDAFDQVLPRLDVEPDGNGNALGDYWESSYAVTTEVLDRLADLELEIDPITGEKRQGDRLTNLNEFRWTTIPIGTLLPLTEELMLPPFDRAFDSDRDGWVDGPEVAYWNDSSNDAITQSALYGAAGVAPHDPDLDRTDFDGDGFLSIEDVDSDGDGISDAAEYRVTGTLPGRDDSDCARANPCMPPTNPAATHWTQNASYASERHPDGITDGAEWKAWNTSGSYHRIQSAWRVDFDWDGMPNNLIDWDADGDEIPDGIELQCLTSCAGKTLAWKFDTDNDGLLDGESVVLTVGVPANVQPGVTPEPADPRWALFTQSYMACQRTSETEGVCFGERDPSVMTSATNRDTDGDGLPDGYEVMMRRLDPSQFNPNVHDSGVDSDDDSGLVDGRAKRMNHLDEYLLRTPATGGGRIWWNGTNPVDPDTDDDGLDDGDDWLMTGNPGSYGYPNEVSYATTPSIDPYWYTIEGSLPNANLPLSAEAQYYLVNNVVDGVTSDAFLSLNQTTLQALELVRDPNQVIQRVLGSGDREPILGEETTYEVLHLADPVLQTVTGTVEQGLGIVCPTRIDPTNVPSLGTSVGNLAECRAPVVVDPAAVASLGTLPLGPVESLIGEIPSGVDVPGTVTQLLSLPEELLGELPVDPASLGELSLTTDAVVPFTASSPAVDVKLYDEISAHPAFLGDHYKAIFDVLSIDDDTIYEKVILANGAIASATGGSVQPVPLADSLFFDVYLAAGSYYYVLENQIVGNATRVNVDGRSDTGPGGDDVIVTIALSESGEASVSVDRLDTSYSLPAVVAAFYQTPNSAYIGAIGYDASTVAAPGAPEKFKVRFPVNVSTGPGAEDVSLDITASDAGRPKFPLKAFAERFLVDLADPDKPIVPGHLHGVSTDVAAFTGTASARLTRSPAASPEGATTTKLVWVAEANADVLVKAVGEEGARRTAAFLDSASLPAQAEIVVQSSSNVVEGTWAGSSRPAVAEGAIETKVSGATHEFLSVVAQTPPESLAFRSDRASHEQKLTVPDATTAAALDLMVASATRKCTSTTATVHIGTLVSSDDGHCARIKGPQLQTARVSNAGADTRVEVTRSSSSSVSLETAVDDGNQVRATVSSFRSSATLAAERPPEAAEGAPSRVLSWDLDSGTRPAVLLRSRTVGTDAWRSYFESTAASPTYRALFDAVGEKIELNSNAVATSVKFATTDGDTAPSYATSRIVSMVEPAVGRLSASASVPAITGFEASFLQRETPWVQFRGASTEGVRVIVHDEARDVDFAMIPSSVASDMRFEVTKPSASTGWTRYTAASKPLTSLRTQAYLGETALRFDADQLPTTVTFEYDLALLTAKLSGDAEVAAAEGLFAPDAGLLLNAETLAGSSQFANIESTSDVRIAHARMTSFTTAFVKQVAGGIRYEGDAGAQSTVLRIEDAERRTTLRADSGLPSIAEARRPSTATGGRFDWGASASAASIAFESDHAAGEFSARVTSVPTDLTLDWSLTNDFEASLLHDAAPPNANPSLVVWDKQLTSSGAGSTGNYWSLDGTAVPDGASASFAPALGNVTYSSPTSTPFLKLAFAQNAASFVAPAGDRNAVRLERTASTSSGALVLDEVLQLEAALQPEPADRNLARLQFTRAGGTSARPLAAAYVDSGEVVYSADLDQTPQNLDARIRQAPDASGAISVSVEVDSTGSNLPAEFVSMTDATTTSMRFPSGLGATFDGSWAAGGVASFEAGSPLDFAVTHAPASATQVAWHTGDHLAIRSEADSTATNTPSISIAASDLTRLVYYPVARVFAANAATATPLSFMLTDFGSTPGPDGQPARHLTLRASDLPDSMSLSWTIAPTSSLSVEKAGSLDWVSLTARDAGISMTTRLDQPPTKVTISPLTSDGVSLSGYSVDVPSGTLGRVRYQATHDIDGDLLSMAGLRGIRFVRGSLGGDYPAGWNRVAIDLDQVTKVRFDAFPSQQLDVEWSRPGTGDGAPAAITYAGPEHTLEVRAAKLTRSPHFLANGAGQSGLIQLYGSGANSVVTANYRHASGYQNSIRQSLPATYTSAFLVETTVSDGVAVRHIGNGGDVRIVGRHASAVFDINAVGSARDWTLNVPAIVASGSFQTVSGTVADLSFLVAPAAGTNTVQVLAPPGGGAQFVTIDAAEATNVPYVNAEVLSVSRLAWNVAPTRTDVALTGGGTIVGATGGRMVAMAPNVVVNASFPKNDLPAGLRLIATNLNPEVSLSGALAGVPLATVNYSTSANDWLGVELASLQGDTSVRFEASETPEFAIGGGGVGAFDVTSQWNSAVVHAHGRAVTGTSWIRMDTPTEGTVGSIGGMGHVDFLLVPSNTGDGTLLLNDSLLERDFVGVEGRSGKAHVAGRLRGILEGTWTPSSYSFARTNDAGRALRFNLERSDGSTTSLWASQPRIGGFAFSDGVSDTVGTNARTVAITGRTSSVETTEIVGSDQTKAHVLNAGDSTTITIATGEEPSLRTDAAAPPSNSEIDILRIEGAAQAEAHIEGASSWVEVSTGFEACSDVPNPPPLVEIDTAARLASIVFRAAASGLPTGDGSRLVAECNAAGLTVHASLDNVGDVLFQRNVCTALEGTTQVTIPNGFVLTLPATSARDTVVRVGSNQAGDKADLWGLEVKIRGGIEAEALTMKLVGSHFEYDALPVVSAGMIAERRVEVRVENGGLSGLVPDGASCLLSFNRLVEVLKATLTRAPTSIDFELGMSRPDQSRALLVASGGAKQLALTLDLYEDASPCAPAIGESNNPGFLLEAFAPFDEVRLNIFQEDAGSNYPSTTDQFVVELTQADEDSCKRIPYLNGHLRDFERLRVETDKSSGELTFDVEYTEQGDRALERALSLRLDDSTKHLEGFLSNIPAFLTFEWGAEGQVDAALVNTEVVDKVTVTVGKNPDADALIQFEVQIEVLDLAAVGQSSPWIALINVKDLKAFHFSVGHPDELIDYFSATLFINGGACGVSLGVEDGRIDVLGDLDGVDDPSVSDLPRMIHLTDRIVGMAEATGIVVGDLHVRVEVGDVGVGIESKDGAWNEIQARWDHVPFGELVEKTVYRAGDFSIVPNVRQLDIKWNGVWYDIGDNWWSSE